MTEPSMDLGLAKNVKGRRRSDFSPPTSTAFKTKNFLNEGDHEGFTESFIRHEAEKASAEDKRQDRRARGYVHWSTENRVPDVGGVGWRTPAGHLLKNQAYYSQTKANKWNLPVHSGPNTWKTWHGPKIRTDADMMERLDHYDEESDQWEAKKCFINTTRTMTLDRFYNKKLNRDQLESSSVWAPHRRAGREVNDCHDHFFGDLDSRPRKELKKVLTPVVLQRDRDAVRQISSRIQNEETWKLAWRHMELERRQDIRHNFRQRQSYNDLLMQLSGQPTREREWEQLDLNFNNCSQRTESLARSKECAPITDVTSQADFRGLFHADNEHALEALMPGNGHELSLEFRQRATASTQAGWPPPPVASTPRKQGKRIQGEKQLQQDASLTTERMPVSRTRLDSVATRSGDDVLKGYAKEQFLNRAPPPPEQKGLLLTEDFSPKSTMHDPDRVTGSFRRIEQTTLPHGPFQASSDPKHKQGKSKEHLPTPSRPYTYPVIVPASPVARGAQESKRAFGHDSEGNSPGSPVSQFHSSVSSPVHMLKRGSSSPAHMLAYSSQLSKRRPVGGKDGPSSAVCRELDDFEASMTALPRVSNFFGTPRSHRRPMSQASIGGRSLTGGLSQDAEAGGMNRAASAPAMQPGQGF